MAHRPYVAVIGPALRAGVPVIGLDTWEIEGVERVKSAEEAVTRALERAAGRDGS